jgi:hypothetical protein
MKYKEFIYGKEAEKKLLKKLKNAIEATKDEDINEHWDVKGIIEEALDGITYKIDVKTIKKQNRYDVVPCEIHHWVELENVLGGDKSGWLYGDADLFAFELKDYWVFVDKMVLQDFIDKKVVDKLIRKNKNPYTLYRRDGRKDVVVKVKSIDLMAISKFILLND